MKKPRRVARVSRAAASPCRRIAPALASVFLLAQSAAWSATFREDVTFLKQHTDVIVLSDPAGKAKVAVSPGMQGRVLTSTAGGDDGTSFGWINRELIASAKVQPHINVFGGEDRFWMGPEGGQFSIFFAKGAPFDLEHWFTPASLDTEPFVLVKQAPTRVEFRHSITLTNSSDTRFNVRVSRAVQLLPPKDAWRNLGVPYGRDVELVAFESINRIENSGQQPWKPETGLLSIWILGMFTPSAQTTIVVPIKAGSSEKLGAPVTSDYFGPVPPERLVVKEKVVFFSGDGQYRSKIGINPLRCKGILGSYDGAIKMLTLVQFSAPAGKTNYVNSKWEIQAHPYGGDVANSYNDGPPSPGAKPLGPFYEMESSSPAAELAPGKFLEHIHRTVHLTGSERQLDRIARGTLGVGLAEIVSALPR